MRLQRVTQRFDRAAHKVMEFQPKWVHKEGSYEAFYHEEQLYSVRNTVTGMVTLVYARSPSQAIHAVSTYLPGTPLHGRLIDADALARQENQAHVETLWTCEDEWKKAVYSAMHRYFQALIADAPTVVEPEGEVETP